jgi:hypothetical protein
MQLRTAFYTLVALTLTGCSMFKGKCSYELRSLDASGHIDQSGSEFAAAQVGLSEERGAIVGTSMSWTVTDDPLKGHVTSASFKDSSNPSQVLLNLPIAGADRAEISFGTAGHDANLGGFHDILVANRGVIELQTDLPGQLTVTIPLTVGNASGWIRPDCT